MMCVQLQILAHKSNKIDIVCDFFLLFYLEKNDYNINNWILKVNTVVEGKEFL